MRPTGTTGLPYPAMVLHHTLCMVISLACAVGMRGLEPPMTCSQSRWASHCPTSRCCSGRLPLLDQVTGPTRRTLLIGQMFVNSFPTSNIALFGE